MDFLTRLAERALGHMPTIAPVVPSLFAPAAGPERDVDEALETEVWRETKPAGPATPVQPAPPPPTTVPPPVTSTALKSEGSHGQVASTPRPATSTLAPGPLEETRERPKRMPVPDPDATRSAPKPSPVMAHAASPPAPAPPQKPPAALTPPLAPRQPEPPAPPPEREIVVFRSRTEPPVLNLPPVPATPPRVAAGKPDRVSPLPPAPTLAARHEIRDTATPPALAAPPAIQVHIGRVEVRAILPAPPAPAPKRDLSAPKLTLEEYLRSPNGARR